MALTRVRTDLDRWFFASMALLFVATAVIGFGPNSLAILSGEKSNPPQLIHLHAALMSAWLLLLTAQSSLIALGMHRHHRKLGMSMLFLAPLIIVLMCILAVVYFPGFESPHGDAILVFQAKRIGLFTLFCVFAFKARNTDRETHKRMIVLATFVVIDAAFNRMPFLPSFGHDSEFAASRTAELALLLPLIVYDLAVLHRLHRATLLGICLILPFTIAAIALW